ncbi:MAG: NADP-dependent malic enzyme [Alphaproteobacteria bacterium]
MNRDRMTFTEDEALAFHNTGKPGKLEITATKPMATQRDLSLAYSPGVAVPVQAIAEEPEKAFDYTTRGNMVAVISNGTAILGLGNLGALASKPVMEGKAVLFKRFADVDSIDLEVDTDDVDRFIDAVALLGPSFGGVNLEDIKAPECFVIEDRLREQMDIPVFHDDQHGTAIISAAGILNALDLTRRSIKESTVVVNGAGAAGIAVLELLKAMGLPHGNAILCDSKGVIYQGRTEGMNQWKSAHAVDTSARTLEEAMDGSDIFIGLSVKGAVTREMAISMADKPIIFAMANPDPEIMPEEVAEIRPDAIMATGRSDYPNQVNNVLGFPYIFRGALDVRATRINDAMKIAAVEALADLARSDVPDEVARAYRGRRLTYGPDYIIPAPFDPRLISHVPPAVAKAAMDSGVARRPIRDFRQYRMALSARLDPTATFLNAIMEQVRGAPKDMVFAEGEEAMVIRAAVAYQEAGLGRAILVGRDDVITANREALGISPEIAFEVRNARSFDKAPRYIERLYERLQRRGHLQRDIQRLVNNDRNVFGAAMVAYGDADAMVTGVTRRYATAFADIRQVVDPMPRQRLIGMSIILARGRTIFVADTSVTEMPTPDELADITIQVARTARQFGYTPRVAVLSSSTFGHPAGPRSTDMRDAVRVLDERQVDFEYDGEMTPAIALNAEGLALYPFARLSGPANVLVMPATHSAMISSTMLQELGGCTVLGPFLVGLEKPVQIVQIGATVNDILNTAAMAALDLGSGQKRIAEG